MAIPAAILARRIERAFFLFVCLAAFCGSVYAQSEKTVTIRMLDSKTGLLIASSNFLVRVNHLEAVHGDWVHQNEDGTGKLTLPADADVISIHATYESATLIYANCDAEKDHGSAEHAASPDRWYSITTILASGVVAPNGCVGKKGSGETAGGRQTRRICLLRPPAQLSGEIPGIDSPTETNPRTLMHCGEKVSLLLDPIPPAAIEFTLQVERLYTSLLQSANTPSAAEPSLGGRLLYAGELDSHGRALLVAGNIAGAASLAATADPAAQKQAIRDGVADFLVNSLDEALRILKNEIRKHETVAVCVGAAPESVESEMLERGVLPDLLPPISFPTSQLADSFTECVARIELLPEQDNQVLIWWRVAAAPAQWLPKLDALAIDCLQPDSYPACRWLRLAPRYLGRLVQGLRVLRCEPDVAKDFVSRVRGAIDRGEIGVEVQARMNIGEEVLQFSPTPGPTR